MDDTYYIGYTSDINRRMEEHKKGINCKYSRARGFKKLEIYYSTNERKDAMKAALNADEREMYERKHLENQARKQELMESLYGTPLEEETVVYAR